MTQDNEITITSSEISILDLQKVDGFNNANKPAFYEPIYLQLPAAASLKSI